ncbi:GNAT family N-acetyltransferase [Winogradskyella aurantiaca]|uniref:GNAT family N-acetyltransferase n=1 Tax=Winogradskyella aurantiaca TaxID=2219558 RepID=UPI000E1C7B1F|nr:GNAT family N-acetyltransferase [Winogradskyella aurantiaca]
MIEVKKVISKKDKLTFIKFPFKIYDNHPYWVPPIISQELETFNEDVNPVFHDAEAQLFLAYKDGEVVGRVAAIINWLEVNNQGVKKMRFGWMDFIDDKAVSKALFDKVFEIAKENNLEFAEGPVGFSNMDKVGVLFEGFDSRASMMTWYNEPYYLDHYESYGFTTEKTYQESKFYFPSTNPESFLKAKDLISKRYKVKSLRFNSTKDIMPHVDDMFDLFNESYARLSSFVEITDLQKEYFKKKFIKFVNPEFINFIVNEQNELIAFAVVMPSFSQTIQDIKGRLFPFGFLKILRARKKSKDAIFYLIGIHPKYQNKGIHALIFNHYYHIFREKGIEWCYRTPELEDNLSSIQIWKHFNSKVYKRRKTYKKML